MTAATSLRVPLAGGRVALELLQDDHLDGLRLACAEDQDIWQIYPVNMLGDGFDAAMEAFHATPDWVRYAVIDQDQGQRIVGMTSYIRPDPANGSVEIGGTYLSPTVRGTGFNTTMKKLMIDHVFACGFRRIEFRVDERNSRSQAAVLKLGATREGLLRAERVTWTGHVRNTCIFGLLKDEWSS